MKRHKYFREQQYKQRLEAKFNAAGNYGKVYFITATPDPRAIREDRNFYERYPDLVPGEYDRKSGRNYYVYYHRPETAYSIVEEAHGTYYKTDLKKCTKNKLKTVCQRNPYMAFVKSLARKTCSCWHFD